MTPTAKLTTEFCKQQLLRTLNEQRQQVESIAADTFDEDEDLRVDMMRHAFDLRAWKRLKKYKIKDTPGYTTGSTCRIFDCIPWGGVLKAEVISDPADMFVTNILIYDE